jgi:hypothetical protein
MFMEISRDVYGMSGSVLMVADFSRASTVSVTLELR